MTESSTYTCILFISSTGITTHVFLSLLFNTFVLHGYLPTDFMKTAIVPIIKNNTGGGAPVTRIITDRLHLLPRHQSYWKVVFLKF